MDYGYFQRLIEKNPFARPAQIKSMAEIDGKFYKERTLDQMILDHRKITFPSDEAQILNNSSARFWMKMLASN